MLRKNKTKQNTSIQSKIEINLTIRIAVNGQIHLNQVD